MEQKVLSITQINEYIRSRLDADPLLGNVAVCGEISNYKLYPSGHHYFTLKDEGGALKCVMFKGNALRLRFRPENGMKVIAMGKISVYPRDGAYQLYCSAMVMDGVGDLHAAFEQLKAKLDEAKHKLGDTGRIVVRPSGTEPLIRVMVEGSDVEFINEVANDVADVIMQRLGNK